MNKTYYSYEDFLIYSLNILKNLRDKSFLNKQEEFYRHLIILCGSSPGTFWACLREKKFDYLSYQSVCKKINSYLFKKEPISYINKKCFFFNLPIKVKKGVFIPQQDTEKLVSSVLLLSKKIWPSTEKKRVLDIGCGSGNIAIALASKRPFWNVFAIDINKKALFLSKENASRLGISNVHFFFSDQFSKVTGKFHIIVSNPPYVAFSEYNDLSEVTKKQPKNALLSSNNGYFFYESILKKVSFFLEKKFIVAFEIGYLQKERVVEIVQKYFPRVKIKLFRDINRNIRVIIFYQQ